jgi:hypothetical protein
MRLLVVVGMDVFRMMVVAVHAEAMLEALQ